MKTQNAAGSPGQRLIPSSPGLSPRETRGRCVCRNSERGQKRSEIISQTENPKSSKKIKISTYNVTPIRLSADFSEETTDQKRARWYVQCAELKKERKKERQPAKSTLSGLFFRNKGEIKILPNKQKLVAFINHH